MKLNLKTYRDKVYACWVGKNIGGTMGTPYEGTTEMLDIQGFVTKANEVLPNDDLDLQLVWLNAVERSGAVDLDCKVLGEYWVSFIVPYWNEYGIGKINMERGLLAPLCGDYNNDAWKNSNGAWIRTEIWASLAPGAPAVAAKYAIEDAKVDHGAGEGTVAAAFVAAMQSAAYVVNDLRTCIDIGLSQIPEKSRTAISVRKVIECYEKKMSARDCRAFIQKLNADIGDGWFQAPSNVAYTVLGLVYGEGDFKKSMITAINCGDDTDCTGATVGATLGILNGTAGIPKDWRAYLGDDIVTVSINRALWLKIPKTCTELTDRVVADAPSFLFVNKANVELVAGKDEIPEDVVDLFKKDKQTLTALENLVPYSFIINSGFMQVTAIFDGAPDIKPGETKKVTLKFWNDVERFGNFPAHLSLRWWLPEGFKVEGPANIYLPHCNRHCNQTAVAEFLITAGEKVDPVNRVVCEATCNRPTTTFIPLTFMG